MNTGADLLMDMFGPEESGYGSQSNTSTANSDPLASLDPLDRLGFEETFFKEKKEQELMDAAMAGQNLLGMVDEGPTRGYDEDAVRSTGGTFQGSALMDFFVDPTQLFASERHPALQEVLKVLSRSKMHRGTFQKIPFVISMIIIFGHFYSLTRARAPSSPSEMYSISNCIGKRCIQLDRFRLFERHKRFPFLFTMDVNVNQHYFLREVM